MKASPFLLLLWLAQTALAGGSAEDYARAQALPRRLEAALWRGKFEAHWTPGGSSFWYSVRTGPQTQEWVQVEPETGTVHRAPTAAGLPLPLEKGGRSVESGESTHLHLENRRAEPVRVFWIDPAGRAQNYGTLEPRETRTQQTFVGHVWRFETAAGVVLRALRASAEAEVILTAETPAAPDEPAPKREPAPVRRWQARIEGAQVILRDRNTRAETAFPSVLEAGESWRGAARWSPEGEAFTLLAVRPAPGRQVTEVESSPRDQVQPKVRTFDYLKPGDELPRVTPVLFHPAAGTSQRLDSALFPNAFTPDGRLEVRWSPKSDEFYFDYNQRGHQLYRILAANAATGAVRTVVEETAKTFIDYSNKTWREWLPKTGELLWMSERDGWCHLYLYDTATGAVKNQVTKGAWVVREVLRVEEEKRQVWFMASGLQPGENPYQMHLCRANLDGSGFARLTAGDGNHAVEFSPDRKFFLDLWSRPDAPLHTELRRSDTGALVTALEQADDAPLMAAGWTRPERFTAKGRDGQTDIWGLLIKPSNFDPAKKYPVLEEVYAGPHGAFVTKDFALGPRQHALAELGFIVVQADGMGTNHRGKAFHEVAWQNLQDAGFPDRIAWIKAAAATRPWMDLAHVGIYGGSAGGQNAMRALLDHHDFYHAAFADCGCHDNRMDKIWWNEQWLGWPVGEAYVRASNVVDAYKLQGALMLSVGELDSNVDPSSTMQVVNALEKAGKDFELMVITGSNHGAAETPYGSRRRMDFFVRHLMGVEPRH